MPLASLKDVRAAYTRKLNDFTLLQKQLNAEADLVKEAEKILKASADELQKAEDLARPREEKKFMEQYIVKLESHYLDNQARFEANKNDLAKKREKRIEWVTRIQKAKSNLEAQQLIDDEIQVLRDIRKQVLKERLMLEMGLDERAK